MTGKAYLPDGRLRCPGCGYEGSDFVVVTETDPPFKPRGVYLIGYRCPKCGRVVTTMEAHP